MAEAHSGLVAPRADLRPKSLSAHLRDARARGEEILRRHPRREGGSDATCDLCLVAYPCDAAQAAQDVIAISAMLRPGRPLSGEALLELMTELVDRGSTAAVLARPVAD